MQESINILLLYEVIDAMDVSAKCGSYSGVVYRAKLSIKRSAVLKLVALASLHRSENIACSLDQTLNTLFVVC